MLLRILVCHEGTYWEDLTSSGVPEGLSEEKNLSWYLNDE